MSKLTKQIDPGKLQLVLPQFTGSDQFYRHTVNRRLIYTDGVRYLAENAHAYWLIDVVASYAGSRAWRMACQTDGRLASLSFWTLEVDADKSAVVTARVDSDCPALIEQRIAFTDFPLEVITLYLAVNHEHGWTLMLPTEY